MREKTTKRDLVVKVGACTFMDCMKAVLSLYEMVESPCDCLQGLVAPVWPVEPYGSTGQAEATAQMGITGGLDRHKFEMLCLY